jgi:uncharacterized protein YciI
MSYFAVIREAGPAWTAGGIFDQPGVAEHAAFMNALADEGFLLFAGPLAGSEDGRVRALLIVNANSDADIHRRLADDPWAPTQQLVTVSFERWQILVGAERLASAAPDPHRISMS